MTTIGIISDNHGDWSSNIAKALEGVDAIIHAGDIGSYQIISKMESIAPTTAVLGNTDGDLPIKESEVTNIGRKSFSFNILLTLTSLKCHLEHVSTRLIRMSLSLVIRTDHSAKYLEVFCF
jgi:putative phosphoesterase